MLSSFIKKLLNNPWVEMAARWFLGVTFFYSAYHKIMDPAAFAKIIYGYKLFPAASINLIAIILPFFEIFSALALCMGVYPRSAALIIEAMLLGFIVAISMNLIRGVKFDCGCFSLGEAGHTISAIQLLVRDIFYFMLGLHILFYRKKRRWCLLFRGK
jgi:putative oxidoreductase